MFGRTSQFEVAQGRLQGGGIKEVHVGTRARGHQAII